MSTQPQPYFADDSVTLWHGDSLGVLRGLPADSVNCCVTSPPYYGLRDYGEPGQYGLEPSPAEYVDTMRAVFAEVRRVLADDGTLWLNLGDSYYSGKGSPTRPDEKNEARRPPDRILDRPGARWAKPKDLLGMPWRTAFALQADGWTLRNAIVWSKPNAMPESVTDRLSTTYELVFLLTKSRRYWFDLDPIREQHTTADRFADRAKAAPTRAWIPTPGVIANNNRVGGDGVGYDERGRNPGDVWTIPPQPFAAAHFAVMPPALAERCILCGCKPGGTVLDPFAGSGTTGMVAGQHGRRFVGIDLSREYLDLALRTRLAQTAIVDEAVA